MIPRHLGGKLPGVPVAHALAFDVSPRRAVAGVNVRREDKVVFDALLAWWSVERGRTLSQWDAFSILLAFALENPELRLPAEVQALASGQPM